MGGMHDRAVGGGDGERAREGATNIVDRGAEDREEMSCSSGIENWGSGRGAIG